MLQDPFCWARIVIKLKTGFSLNIEISAQGEEDGTACAVVNQARARVIKKHENHFSVQQQPIDNFPSGTIPPYRDFPG